MYKKTLPTLIVVRAGLGPDKQPFDRTWEPIPHHAHLTMFTYSYMLSISQILFDHHFLNLLFLSSLDTLYVPAPTKTISRKLTNKNVPTINIDCIGYLFLI